MLGIYKTKLSLAQGLKSKIPNKNNIVQNVQDYSSNDYPISIPSASIWLKSEKWKDKIKIKRIDLNVNLNFFFV